MPSAVNIETPASEVDAKEGNGKPRPNPVALEAVVDVTGAKPTVGGGARDLFFEETTTVLVFKDGAVIRLAAPVSVGQLLFLTNKRSNQEVVCQVLRKRSYKPGTNYVELQFTEERADYWGVAFPEEKKGGAEFRAVEQVQAEETTAEPVEIPVAPHSAEDVDQLKREVEALREQLAELERKNVEEVAAKAMAEAAAARESAAREAAMRDAAKAMEAIKANAGSHAHATETTVAPTLKMNTELPKGNEHVAATQAVVEEKPELLMRHATAKDKAEVARPVVSMSLPVWKMEKSPEEQLLEEEAAAEIKTVVEPVIEATEELLPKPELDFTQTVKNAGKVARSSRSMGLSLGSGKARMMGLSVALVLLVAGGAWYGKWWKYLPVGKKAVESAAIAAQPSARATVAATKNNAGAPAAAGSSGAAVPEGANGVVGSGAASTGKESGKDEKSGSGVKAPAAPAQTAPPSAPVGTDTVAGTTTENPSEPAAKKPSWRERFMGKKSAEKVEDAPSAAETVASDAPVLPAKLLKAASPVYPVAAIQNYITGDVKAEVVVGASGHVGDVKVISGPKALQAAAVEALKKYEYEAATQGGKAVESKTVAVVKFWFNP